MSDHKEPDSKKSLNLDDVELWRRMTHDVQRLEGRDYQEPDAGETPVIEGRKSKQPQDKAEAVAHVKPVASGKTGRDLDANTMKRLRKGEIPIDGSIDLHGMNQGEARQALIGFIRASQAMGKRCVIVVTGKGNSGRSAANWFDPKPGVLKRQVPVWLQEGEIGHLVLQAVPARPKHGGGGALYVYLRRDRTS